jgi:hypothetical protein
MFFCWWNSLGKKKKGESGAIEEGGDYWNTVPDWGRRNGTQSTSTRADPRKVQVWFVHCNGEKAACESADVRMPMDLGGRMLKAVLLKAAGK